MPVGLLDTYSARLAGLDVCAELQLRKEYCGSDLAMDMDGRSSKVSENRAPCACMYAHQVCPMNGVAVQRTLRMLL